MDDPPGLKDVRETPHGRSKPSIMDVSLESLEGLRLPSSVKGADGGFLE